MTAEITAKDVVHLLAADPGAWGHYRKVATTMARRMAEDFTVETLEGVRFACAGDWLAIDVDGNPYPIDASVFERSYEPAP